MNRLLEELKYNFKKENNGLAQLILINVVVFVVVAVIFVVSAISKNDSALKFIYDNTCVPPYWINFIHKPWTILTYAFMHTINPFHIIFNMLGLYWFGKIVQEYIGSRRLVNLYILGAIVGSLTYLLLTNHVQFFHERAGLHLVGASGAVFAVAVAAATLVPEHRFFLIFIGPVKIVYIVAFYIFISFLQMVGPNSGGNVCHLGGALLGFSYIYMLRKGTDLGQPINFIASKFKKLRRGKLKVSYKKNENKEVSQKDIDAILDKISRSGYDSLTKEEKQKLFKASQK